jgi:subtilisin family serine protease
VTIEESYVTQSFTAELNKKALIASALLLFLGCSPMGKVSGELSLASSLSQCLPRQSKALVSDQSQFTSHKMQISELSLGRAPASIEGLSLINVAPETKIISAKRALSLTVDFECIAEKGLSTFLSELLQDQKHIEGMKVQSFAFEFSDSIPFSEFQAAANQEPCLIGISENAIAKTSIAINDTLAPKLAHLDTIKASNSWTGIYSTAPVASGEVIVATIDTGADYNHPDLAGQIWTSATGTHGYDFVNGDTDPMDDNGHGTHCAGLIAAKANNNLGVAGVAPQNVKVMAIKALDMNGSGSLTNIANGIRWAADNGANVISMSLGARALSTAVQDAVAYAVGKGVVMTAAAGNDGLAITPTNVMVPAYYAKDVSGLISVGATVAETDAIASFSNFSTTYVEISAPGSVAGNTSGGLLSTYPSNRYAYMAGTSMATPLVSGSAALAILKIRASGQIATPTFVENILESSTRKLASLNTKFKEGRLLDIGNLAALITSTNSLIFVTQPGSKNMVMGESLTLSADVNQSSGVSFQWKKDGVAIAGAISKNLTLPSVDFADAGIYQVVATYNSVSRTSSAAHVTIYSSYCSE